MESLNQFHFLRPWFLLALPLVIGILWFRHQSRHHQDNLQDFCDPHLMPALIDQDDNQNEQRSTQFIGLAIFSLFSFLIVGLAGPAWDKQAIPLLEPQNARVVVLGLAPSMSKSDIAPTRFTRAKFKTMDLIRSAPAVLQALVIYSDDAFVVSPLSDDHNTLLNLLKAVELDTVPTTGNRADKGLELAEQLLDQPSLSYREIVLVTDTASPLSLHVAKQLSAKGVDVSVLSINLPGAPGADVLKAIANTGNGAFTHLQPNTIDIDNINSKMQRSSLLNLNQRQESQDQFGAEEYRDNGVWLLILALVMAPFLFRKGWLLGLVLVPFSFIPSPVHAFEWSDLWQRQDQQAAQLYQQGQFEDTQLKSAKQWQGAASYRLQDYEGAVNFLNNTGNPESLYNAGNAYAQQGHFKEALAAYERTIELDPNHSDAQHNRGIVNKIIEQQKSQDQQKEQDSEQDGDQQNAEQQDNQSNSDESQQQKESDAEQSNSSDVAQEQDQAEQDQEAQQQETPEETEEPNETNPQDEVQAQAEPIKSEDQQALEQWLRKLPDDPGALLKRKFKVQHQQRQQATQQSTQQ